MYRLAHSKFPFDEKIALFWHRVFATGQHKLIQGKVMTSQIEMFRDHGLGSFEDILMGCRACASPGGGCQFLKSSEGEEAIRDADLSGDSIILTRLMNNAESFAEAFEGIDIERLFYTYFSAVRLISL